MKLSETKLRKIIRNAILENVSQITPEQREDLDLEIRILKSKQSYLEQWPKAYNEKEFLMNVENILEALVSGQYQVDDFKPWVSQRWNNYTPEMYQELLDTVFNV